MIWDGAPFGGAKLAAMQGNSLLAYRRDDRADIPFPGMIDLPGGGREGSENPAECAVRELAKEFGIGVSPDRLHYHRSYMLGDGATRSHFFAVHLTVEEVGNIMFGDEGQDWALMPAADFIAEEEALPRLREWVAQYLAAAAAIRYPDTISENPGKA